MASYNKSLLIQQLNSDSEKWSDYYFTHANVNKTGGKEYFKASTEISKSTYTFKVRYCEKLEDILFNTESYRLIYKNRIFDIKNVDRYKESMDEVTIIGEYNGRQNNINQ